MVGLFLIYIFETKLMEIHYKYKTDFILKTNRFRI